MADEATPNPVRISERIGKYEILGHIATGGMGVVYLARDVDLDRRVALKILPPAMAKQQITLTRFQREAKAAAQLRHENIVTIFDVGETNGTYFIALEYVDGTDLQAYISRKCRLEPSEARSIMVQAARALAHAHEQGIVHRDIKPSNFLLMVRDKRLIVKLTDFGLAIREENPEEFRITRDKTTVGTVDYMSPEQARDSRSADIRSDIYSLGCTFYHMLAGTAPFARGTLPERLVQHMTAAPPDMRKLNKGVPEDLVAVINRMLAKAPEDRYQSPAELLRDLENPGKVAGPRKRTLTAKRARATAARTPGDTTAVIENKELDKASAVPPQVKTAKRGKADELPAVEDKREIYPEVEHEVEKREIRPEVDHEAEETEFGTDAPEDEIKDFGEDVDDDEVDEDEVEEDDEDEDDEDDDDKKPMLQEMLKKIPLWVYGAVASFVFVLFVIVILALIFGGRTPPPKKPPEKPPEKPAEKKIIPDEKPEPAPPSIDTSPSKMSVGWVTFPPMDVDPAKADAAALRKEYAGPFGPFPESPVGRLTPKVRRLAPVETASYASIADALTATKSDPVAVIEIADNGPIFMNSLPAQQGRTITLRGARGYRPLLVWDAPSDAKTVATLLSLTKGQLVLDNLDIAVRAPETLPAVLFDLPDSDFHARDCTFSFWAEKDRLSAGTTLVRRAAGKEEPGRTQTRLQRCYLRGTDATLLSHEGVAGDLLVEDALVVGYQQPLIQVHARDDDALALYCVRSTLVTGQVLLRWQAPPNPQAKPRVQARILDSILSRDDPSTGQGDLIQLVGASDLSGMSWKSSNSVYAGWMNLLKTPSRAIAGHELDAWRKQWKTTDGERALDSKQVWPNRPPPRLHECVAEDEFLPVQTRVGFAALTGSGPIGCVLGLLPTPPEAGWYERVFKHRHYLDITRPSPEVPAISKEGGGQYHGERLDLTKVDLGAHLNTMLDKMSPGPRVVMHLTGKGDCEMTPLRVKGVHLVLYFEPSKDAKKPLTLGAAYTALKQSGPMIEMTDGHLEIINARMRLSNVTNVPTMIQVHASKLTLTDCFLQGPLVRAPDSFKYLIGASNTGGPPTELLLRNNVLLAGKTLIQLDEHVQLRALNNVFVALGDGVTMDCAKPPPPLEHVLKQNTWAVRQTLFLVRTAPEPLSGGPVLVHAERNAFLNPFTDELDKATLLRGAESWSANGTWVWQGARNVYDPRLYAYYAGGQAKAGIVRQSLKDWQRAWGPFAEKDVQPLDPAAAAKTLALDGAAPPAVLLQLERLRGLGADFEQIRHLKK